MWPSETFSKDFNKMEHIQHKILITKEDKELYV
jgi:hypothetical protein